MSPILTALVVLLLVASYRFNRRPLKLPRELPPSPALTPDADGATPVPVRRVSLRRNAGPLSSHTTNGIRPSFAIAPDGLRFKIFREGHWSWAEIEQVEARKPPLGGPRLLFVGTGRRQVLTIVLADFGLARSALRALPVDLPLSPDAATVRDGTPAAAAPGLRRYRGPAE